MSLQPEVWYGSSLSLRESLPNKVYYLFVRKLSTIMLANTYDKSETDIQRMKVQQISTIMMDLKNQRVCDKIMSYAPELFFDPFFVDAEMVPQQAHKRKLN